MSLQIAQIFLGKYSVLGFIGQGAFGRVYLAEEVRTRSHVVIKELRQDLPEAQQWEARERFEREIEIGRRLDHPHVVKMLTYEEHDGNIYLVLEYMAGGSLRQRLEHEGPLPIAEVVRIAIEVCQALEYLHQHPLDLVHRDVTPSNILFAADGTAKLMDFGVVQSPGYTWSRWSGGRQEHPGHPFYRAPEARDSDPLRPTADVYMLGCVLWEMLTGHVYLHQPPGTPPSRLRPETPPELDALVLKAVAENWRERYHSAYEFKAVLARFQAAQEAAARAKQQAAEDARRTAEEQARQQRLAGWFSDAERLVSHDPERALALVAQIRSEEPEYPGVAELETQSQNTLAQRQKRVDKARRQQELERLAQAATEHLREKRWGEVLRSADELEGLGGLGRYRAKGIRRRVRREQQAQAKEQEAQGGKGKRMSWLVAGLAALALIVVLVVTRPEWWCRFFPTPEPRTRSKDGMVMVYVPAGEFTMGSTDAQIQAAVAQCVAGGAVESLCETVYQAESPQHLITLDAFWIDQTEVSNAQYKGCVQAGACSESGCPGDRTLNGNSQPVACVSWNDAAAYCRWAGARLPTEAEWEKAARGADGRIYPWGSETPDCSKVNYGHCVGQPSAVGSYPNGAGPYGTEDMAGNVWEWVNDWYDWLYYRSSPSWNPPGASSGSVRVLRGGSWPDGPEAVRSANRNQSRPDFRGPGNGFRCGFSSASSP